MLTDEAFKFSFIKEATFCASSKAFGGIFCRERAGDFDIIRVCACEIGFMSRTAIASLFDLTTRDSTSLSTIILKMFFWGADCCFSISSRDSGDMFFICSSASFFFSGGRF